MKICAVDYDHPDAIALRHDLQQFYVERYGGPDNAPVDPSEFRPPRGASFVGYLDGRPVASGSWHSVDVNRFETTKVAEIKRVHVAPNLRRRGLARQILAELENTAREANHEAVVLSTGLRQPEAIALYEGSGYTSIEGFGHWAHDNLVVFLGKRL